LLSQAVFQFIDVRDGEYGCARRVCGRTRCLGDVGIHSIRTNPIYFKTREQAARLPRNGKAIAGFFTVFRGAKIAENRAVAAGNAGKHRKNRLFFRKFGEILGFLREFGLLFFANSL